MAKRFTATEKWSDPWFRRLSPAHKLAYLMLLDACNLAGVVDLDEELAEFQIGAGPIDWRLLIEASEGRIVDLDDGKLWLSKFVSFQNGEIDDSSQSKAVQAVINSLKKHSLWERYSKGIHTLQGKGKGKGKGKSKGRGRESRSILNDAFESWWSTVPKKAGKQAAAKAYRNAVAEIDGRDGPGGDDPLGFLAGRMAAYAASPKGRGRYVHNPATWLNGGHYDDDDAAWQQGGGGSNPPDRGMNFDPSDTGGDDGF